MFVIIGVSYIAIGLILAAGYAFKEAAVAARAYRDADADVQQAAACIGIHRSPMFYFVAVAWPLMPLLFLLRAISSIAVRVAVNREAPPENSHSGRILAEGKSTMVNEATPAPSEMISEHHPCRARAIASIIDDLDGVLDGLIQRRGIYTGFKEVDELISGLQPDHLYIVGARPSMGKTSFVLNITEHVALRESTTVLYFTLGQSPAQLAQAMLCSHARVNSNKIRRGEIFDYERVRLKESANALRGAKVIFEDLSAATTADLYQSIRRTKITDDVGLVVIDDMQSVRADCVRTAADSCEQEVAEIVRGLKKIAVELKLPIVLTSQINRRTDRRQDRRPLLSDLQGSGAIEELADVVLLLYREGYYDPRAGVNHPCEVIVGKNRWGPTGTANLTFLKEFTRFQDF